MKSWTVIVTSAVLLSAASNAMGANAESKERAAKKACLVGDVEKGVELLADLYVDTNDPAYLYNQGRCFEQNGKNAQAVLRFKEYLRKAKDRPKTETDAVLQKIAELQGTAGQPEAQPVPAPAPVALAPAASAVPPSASVATTPDPLGIQQSAPPPEPQESPPVYKRWWFWTGIGAVVAGGVVTGILLSKKSAPQSPACDGLGTCVP
jgi:hypothetical protein